MPRGADDEQALTEDIIALAKQYGRYGYRRVTALLRSAGWTVNRKRVERIWRREELKVPQKQPKRGRLWLNDGSCIRLLPEYPRVVRVDNEVANRNLLDRGAIVPRPAVARNSSFFSFRC